MVDSETSSVSITTTPTTLRRGVIILGLAAQGGNSLIISLGDKRSRQKTVTVFHEHITTRLDPKWIYTDWHGFLEPSTQELADNGMAIQEQMCVLINYMSDEPVVQELEQSETGVLGLYLGKWFLNPERDLNGYDRVIMVLISDRAVWIPIRH